MKIKKGFVVREVGGETVVVPVGSRSKDFHGMVNLNSTAAFMWNFFTEERTEEEAVAAVCAEYNVAEEKARADVARFVEQLRRNGFAE